MPTPGVLEFVLIATQVLLYIAIIVVIGRIVVRFLRRPDPAMDALRTRFANGDIDELEYERLRSVLQRG
jgi:uncharacterized membrane protein